MPRSSPILKFLFLLTALLANTTWATPRRPQHAPLPVREFNLRVGRAAESKIYMSAQRGSFKVEVLHPTEGRLIGSFIQRNGNDDSFLTTYSFQEDERSVAQKVFPFEGRGINSGRAQDPLWSPDRRYVLFKYGIIADAQDTFSLYVWDTQTNALQLVTSHTPSYLQVSWSPDSKYIAFVLNGDIYGSSTFANFNTTEYIGPLKLYVCNWRTGEEQLVTSNDTLHGPFTWLAPHTLLYDVVSEKNQAAIQRDRVADWKRRTQKPRAPVMAPLGARPDIYKYLVGEKRPHLLIANGTGAAPSPDGQHIAFLGSKKPGFPFSRSNRSWGQIINDDALLVVKSDGTERKVLSDEHGFCPSLIWMPDNVHLLSLQQTKESPSAECPDAKATVKEWNTVAGTSRQIGILSAKGFQAFPAFQAASVSLDGTLFYVITHKINHEFTQEGEKYTLVDTLQEIQLDSGQVTPLVRLTNSSGLDWFPLPLHKKHLLPKKIPTSTTGRFRVWSSVFLATCLLVLLAVKLRWTR